VQEVGKRIPATSTAIGLALLARKTDDEVMELAGGSFARIEASRLAARLNEIRRARTAAISSAIIPGIAAIGAAVGEPAGGEALGFALSYPVSATDEKLRARMAERLRAEGMRIGERLGDPAWVGLDPAASIIDMRSLRPPRRPGRAPRARKAGS